MSLENAIAFVESLSAKGQLRDLGFLVARDFAQENGVRLRVTSNRRVNIKKSNRRRETPTIEALNGWFKRHFSEPRWDSERIFWAPPESASEEYTLPIMESVTIENGFTYAGRGRAFSLEP